MQHNRHNQHRSNQHGSNEYRTMNRHSNRMHDDSGAPWGLLAAATLAGAAVAMFAPKANKMMAKRKTNGKDDVQAMITINRPASELYRSWREYDRFSDFMPDVISVEPSADGREADWCIHGPGGSEMEFRSRITEDEPDRLIAWESRDEPEKHEGRVTFQETERGTVVRLNLNLHPPMGPLGEAAAWIVGKSTGTDPQTQARRALREFKRIMENDGTGASGSGGSASSRGRSGTSTSATGQTGTSLGGAGLAGSRDMGTTTQF